jgi:quercetin 2,3-dioxygenase
MIEKIAAQNLYLARHGWLESRFHFSFAEYYDPANIRFGALRVLNDDIIHPNSGFDTHAHSNMEIISYIVQGEITHTDSMGNEKSLKRGEVQYMSAGSGVAHSEFNQNPHTDLRLLQIWIMPQTKNTHPRYGEMHYTYEQRHNTLCKIVSSQESNAPVKINQNAEIFVSELDAGKTVSLDIKKESKVYFVQIEGSCHLNALQLDTRDAARITSEEQLEITAIENAHILFIVM